MSVSLCLCVCMCVKGEEGLVTSQVKRDEIDSNK